MGDVPTAITMGVMLQLAFMGSVTPGAAVAWDLSFASYIGVAGALAFHTGDMMTTIALMWLFSTIGGAIGVAMWNLVYALDLACNRVAQTAADNDNPRGVAFANAGLGNLIGFVCRFVPALVILLTTAVIGSQTGVNLAEVIPPWIVTCLSIFGGMMAALGMGILLSFLLKNVAHFAIFLLGFMLIGYLGLGMMAVAMFAICVAILYYYILNHLKQRKEMTSNG